MRGERRWVVYHLAAGKRKRSFFKDKDSAESEAESLRAQLASDGVAWGRLLAHERNRLIALYSKAIEMGVDFEKAIQDASSQPLNSPKFSEVITELIAVKDKSGRSSDYTKNLNMILNQFALGRESTAIAKIVLADVETFLDSKRIESRSTLRSRLSTLFKFAVRRGYRVDNPCARLESVTVTKQPPKVFTVEELQSCLKWLRTHRPKALGWFVLSTLCGLRPEEAEKTTAKDIHFGEGFIKVEAQTTKVRQRRVVYPKAEAMALLKRCRIRPISHQLRRRAIRALREHLGWESWPKDITRHTAASYWLADCESTAAVAKSLGNSESILMRHYAAIVTREQAKKFWRVK